MHFRSPSHKEANSQACEQGKEGRGGKGGQLLEGILCAVQDMNALAIGSLQLLAKAFTPTDCNLC